jgi:hypothetical protein
MEGRLIKLCFVALFSEFFRHREWIILVMEFGGALWRVWNESFVRWEFWRVQSCLFLFDGIMRRIILVIQNFCRIHNSTAFCKV